MSTLFIVILIVIALVLTVYGSIKYCDEWIQIIPTAFLSVLLSAIIGGIIYCVTWAGTEKCDFESHHIKLYGLSNSSGINGGFVLGTGTIRNTQYIFYNAAVTPQYVKTFKLPMSSVKFAINEKETYLERIHHSHVPRIPGLFDEDYEPFNNCDEYIFHLRKEDMNIRNYYDINNY